MRYAQIKDGSVKNIIILDDVSLEPLFSTNPITGEPFDFFIQLDQVFPECKIDDLFDGKNFTSNADSEEAPPDEADAHIKVNQTTTPKVIAGQEMGSNAQATLISGSDAAGSLQLVTDKGPIAGVMLNIVFEVPYDSTPTVMVTPTNKEASAISKDFFIKVAQDQFYLVIGSPPAGLTTYEWNYMIVSS